MSSLDARALTLTAHGHSYPLRDAPLFTPANRGPCGTRHIHARRRNRAPKLACHADRTQTCLSCEFQALQTLPPLHPHAHPHRTAQGRVESGHKTYWRCLQRTRPHISSAALSGAQGNWARCPGGPAAAARPKTITCACFASSRMLLPGARCTRVRCGCGWCARSASSGRSRRAELHTAPRCPCAA